MSDDTWILGGGMTGLAAGMVSGLPVLEAADAPGGICSSYYLRPGDDRPLAAPPADGEAYRFEIGGGHWIFGGDPVVLEFLHGLVPMRRYDRRSSVYFPDGGRFVPYPLQNHLRFLERDVADAALAEMAQPGRPATTMADWLTASFGPTLCELFFTPFHALYTAGLHDEIAPQDAYKSPVDLALVRRGAAEDAPAVGYNTTFLYPEGGLDLVSRRMAERARLSLGQRVVRIDAERREIELADGARHRYRRLLSTLPLDRALAMTGVRTARRADPHTSVLVLNVGAVRGARCPDDHWLYVPHSKAGFHRVGFYSNVERSFLPAGARAAGDRVSIYVERGYRDEARPTPAEIDAYAAAVVQELTEWGFIGAAEVVHPTWIDVAYTWSWPGSRWKEEALGLLAERGVFQVGRYGRWIFQGIADSIRDGFVAGGSLGRHPRGGIR